MRLDTTTKLDAFETQTCTRCGGSGNYSYCSMYGTTCFACSGKGKTYTKRAQVAIAYMRELRTVAAGEVKIGWLLYEMAGPLGGKTGWFTVTAAGESTSAYCTTATGQHQYYEIDTTNGGRNTFADSKVQAVQTREKLAETRAAAVAYQSTLSKTGKPYKRALAA